MPASFIIGIDLGTTNCAVAYAAVEAGAEVCDFEVPQLVQAGQLASFPTLPSCLYLPGQQELPEGSLSLPWEPRPAAVTGEFARWLGSRVPGRLVLSSKSWLCHPGVDRSAAILPWGAAEGIAKLSPVDAACTLLRHLEGAWDQAHPGAPLRKQDVIITVPASFDEVARTLTGEAARRLGFEQLSLVEEPQAAFYDFIRRRQESLAHELSGVRLVLVVDVGGGTTDLTLIQVDHSSGGEPALRRIAVGDHVMLGGDNMDIALARLAEERLASGGRRLAAAQWTQLVHAARSAKETLLSEGAPERHAVSIAGAGSKLLGSVLSCELGREETRRCVLEGFFPACAASERPRRTIRAAFQELGLPYAQDAAITRHVAGFLSQHAKVAARALGASSEAELPRPDAILLNGGVFKSSAIVGAVSSALAAWWPGQGAPKFLQSASLDLAVARGAVARGLARAGLSRGIAGGSAHSYYIGLSSSDQDDPRVVCVLPRGSTEGALVELAERSFTLSLGRPVSFPLYASNNDKEETAGRIGSLDAELQPLPPLQAVLRAAGGGSGTEEVHLQACLTELGTLELFCVSRAGDQRWRLEFDLRRGLAGAGERSGGVELVKLPEEVTAFIERFFGHKPLPLPAKEFKQAFRQLEEFLGPREQWSLPLLRELWRHLDELSPQRRRGAEHERLFFQLYGYTLRPGFGHPLDDWRCEQSRRLFPELLRFPAELSSWNEFWIFWRRIGAGLTEAAQAELWSQLMPHLARRVPLKPSKNLPRPKGIPFEGVEEMLRVAASLELVAPLEKVRLGTWLAERLQDNPKAPGPWAWALGRLGARVPLSGSVHKVVPQEKAAEWLSLLLNLGLDRIEGGGFAAAQLARLSGDRERDIDESLRQRTLASLEASGASPRLRRLVAEQVELDAAEQAKALGDSLPLGLRLG